VKALPICLASRSILRLCRVASVELLSKLSDFRKNGLSLRTLSSLSQDSFTLCCTMGRSKLVGLLTLKKRYL